MIRQSRWTLVVWVLLSAISFANGPDFFDLSWGDTLSAPEWIVERNESVRQIISSALALADVPPSMMGNNRAADAFFEWQLRRDWSDVQVRRRANERSTVAGFPVESIRYYTANGQLVAVDVVFQSADPADIANAMRTRYGSTRDVLDMIVYEDDRTRATFLVRLLVIESVQHLQALGDHIYAAFLYEYEADPSNDDLW